MSGREFNLSNTPNTAALIIVSGEVQDNHVHNFGKIMRYGNVATVSTVDLENEMPTVGVPLSFGSKHAEKYAAVKHRRDCGTWIVKYVAQELDLEPYTYDVHLLDGTEGSRDEDPDMFAEHWRSLAQYMSINPDQETKDTERPSLLWTYRPFVLAHSGVEQLGQDPHAKPTLEELASQLEALRLPEHYRYADATLLGECGDLKSAYVEFGYPTNAIFTRVTYPEPGTVNADGDRVFEITEVSRRTFAPEIPVDAQGRLDGASEVKRALVYNMI